LLIEEGRTNLATYSGALVFNIGWSFFQALPATSGAGPDGNTAYRVTETAALDNHVFGNTGGTGGSGATSVVSGTVYTGSIFLKKVAGSVDWVQLTFGGGGFGLVQYANFNIGTGTVGNSTGLASGTVPRIEAFPNGWYRCSISVAAIATTSSTSNVVVAFTNNLDAVSRAPVYTGSTSNSVLASLCQFEAASFPTSYIPTTTGTLARSADVCSITGANFTSFNSTAGFTALCNFSFLDTTTAGAMSPIAVNQSSANGVFLYKLITSSDFRVYHVSTNTSIGSITANFTNKAAMAYDGDSVVGVLSGGAVSVETGSTALSFTEMTIGSNRSSAHQMSGHIAAIRYYKKRLPNAKLQSLTA
jgi:hypothetical protein